MGYIVEKNRPTRFPPSGPRDERSHMADLRELEDAILALQKSAESAASKIEKLEASNTAMEKRIYQLEADNVQLSRRVNALEKK